MKPLHALGLAETLREMREGRLAVRAYAEGLVARIEASDAAIDAWAWLDRDQVLR